MDKPLWMWAVFFAVVLVLLILDLGVFNKKDHEIGIKESLLTSAFYICMGLLFGAFVWFESGAESGSLYLTGFLVEKTLSLDNIFVISLIFSYFSIPAIYQHRVLFWGILGVVFLRGIMIGLGTQIVSEFEWVLYIFAAFLIFTGAKMLFMADNEEMDVGDNPVLKFLTKWMRVTDNIEDNSFFVRKKNMAGKMVCYATPLFLALVVIECVDLIFAVDSIPAILSLTTDPFIVYTSNIFAILGLRALYFAVNVVIARFHYMKYALALVLVFIGSKVFLVNIFDLDHFPAWLSLSITVGLLTSGILYSLYKTRHLPPLDLSEE